MKMYEERSRVRKRLNSNSDQENESYSPYSKRKRRNNDHRLVADTTLGSMSCMVLVLSCPIAPMNSQSVTTVLN